MQMTLKVNVLHIQQIWNTLQPGLPNMFMQIVSTNRAQQAYKRACLKFQLTLYTWEMNVTVQSERVRSDWHFERENYLQKSKLLMLAHIQKFTISCSQFQLNINSLN